MRMNFVPIRQHEIGKHQFYQIPKILFVEPYKSKLTNNSRMVYAFLLDRAHLSIQNGWADSDGSVFLLYTRKNLADDTGIGERTITKCMQELEDMNLLREVSQGFGKANKIYVGEINADITMKDISGPAKNAPDNISGPAKIAGREPQKLHSNNTNTNKTKRNTNLSKDKLGVNAGQTKLIDVPVVEKKQKEIKKSHRDIALEKIASAKQKKISWDKVTPRDFTYYYIEKHNEKMQKKITFDRYSSVGIIRDNLINAYSIPASEVCMYIDKLIELYSTSPQAWDSLTFNMIQKSVPMMKDLMRRVKMEIDYQHEAVESVQEMSEEFERWKWKNENIDKLSEDDIF